MIEYTDIDMHVCLSVFSQDVVGLCSVGLCVLVAYVLLANTNLFLSKPLPTSLDTLANADLTSTTAGETLYKEMTFNHQVNLSKQ